TDDEILYFGSESKSPVETLPAPEEILFRNTRVAHYTTTAAVARSDAEGSGGSFLDIDQQIDGVWLRGFFRRQLNVFKISRALKGITALRNLAAGIELLLRRLYLSTHNFVPGLRIPGNQDTVKINRRPLGNHQCNIHLFLGSVDFGNGVHLRKREALIGIHVRDSGNVVAEAASSKNLSGCYLHLLQHLFAVEKKIPANFNLADTVLLPLINPNDDFKTISISQDNGLIDFMIDVAVVVIVV